VNPWVFPDKKQSLAGKALMNNDIYQKLLILLLAACGWPGWVESLRGGNCLFFSPRRQARKGVWGKNKIYIEIPCGLCASARDKNK
jgi:hypothetical protein